MTSVARISRGASSATRIRATPKKPTATPINAPPMVISTKRIVASPNEGWPATMVASTALKTATPVPSLKRLSPSRMAASPAGALSWRRSVTTAMGSVAARIAPSSIPLAQLKPSARWVRVPIKRTVRATPTVARRLTGSRRRRSSGRSRVRAASNTSPGTKARRITSAPTCGSCSPGSSPTTTPAAASTTGYGSIRARLETRPSTVASAPTRMSSSRKRCWGVTRLDLEGHAVPRRFDLGAETLREVGGQLPGVRAPHGHPVVGENCKARLGVADDSLSVVEAQVGQTRATLHEDDVDDHDLGSVLLRDAVVVLGVGNPAEPVPEPKSQRLHLMDGDRAGGELEPVDVVRGLGLQPHDLLGKMPQVLEHDGVVVQRV